MSTRQNDLYVLSKAVGSFCKKRNLKIAVSESCTGGLLSSVITDIPGSSEYFVLGAVVYSKEQKKKLLKISESVLRKYSPVSEETAVFMAENVRKLAKTDIGVGITGYAGPSGGTKKNPKGTVYIAVSEKGFTRSRKYLFRGRRGLVKEKAVHSALLFLTEWGQVSRFGVDKKS